MVRALVVLLITSLPMFAGQKKSEYPVSVRIHAEARSGDGDSFGSEITLARPAKTITISKIPIVSERDFVAFFPFQAPDGSFGAYFKVDAHGTNKLEVHTTEYRDTLVVALVNGRVASAMNVDRKITDGIVLVPAGFQPDEIIRLQTKIPVIGNEKDFAAQKKKAHHTLKAQQVAQKENEPKPTPKPSPTPKTKVKR